jgi:hypothetical protein
VLKKHLGYFHEDVRLQAVIALQHLFTAIRAAFPSDTISPEAKHVLDIIMEQYIKIMNEDDDKDTVSQVCSSIVEVIKSVTYDSVEKCKRELITSSLLSALFFSNTQKRPSTIIILGFNKKISRIFITCLYACCSHGLVVSVSQMGDTFFLWLFFWGIFCVGYSLLE